MNISQDDLLDALQAAMTPTDSGSEGFHTVAELSANFGKPGDRIRKALQIIHTAGRLETRQVRRPAIDGRPIVVPAYRVKPDAA